MKREHPNISILKRLDLTNITANAEIIAEDFVWHYFNPQLPEMQGDYPGLEGLADFFKRMAGNTNATFKVNPISVIPMGDELVVTHVKDTMLLKGKHLEVDAVVVWSIFKGKIKEAWDIPAVNTATVMEL